MIQRYISKPVAVEAVKWTGDNLDDLLDLMGPGKITWTERETPLGVARDIQILAGQNGDTGWVPLPIYNYAVRWPDDETDVWPMDPARFESRYDLAERVE